ncbi:MAG: hypothetical protein NVS4B1_11390 [Ktedonobacteraceae bacterium]
MFSGLVLHKQRYQCTGGGVLTHIYSVLAGLLFVSFCLAGCSGLTLGGGTSSTPTTKGVIATTVPQVALADLHWCGKPILVFRDEGSTKSGTPTVSGTPASGVTPPTTSATPIATPKTLTDWKQVEPNLGFTVFLPQTLPQGACLISASGTIHDPTFGGIFTIGYVLPNHDAISFSEAPLASQGSTFQCSPSNSVTGVKSGTPTPGPTFEPVQLCTGARSTTNIVLSARGATAALEQTFRALQPHVPWVPAN